MANNFIDTLDYAPKKIGNLFRRKREALGLYQSQVAEELGISQAYYSMMEVGRRNIDFMQVWKICKILGISFHELEFELMSDEEKQTYQIKRQACIENIIRKALSELDSFWGSSEYPGNDVK